MTSILEYYRNPIFSIILLVCLILIVLFASNLLGFYKERSKLSKAKSFVANLKTADDLEHLSTQILYEFSSALMAANKFMRAKECLIILANRGEKVAYELALCDIKLGLFSQAVKSCELALSFIARDSKTLKALIYAHFAQGDIASARTAAKALAVCENSCKTLDFLSGKLPQATFSESDLEFVCPKCHKLSFKYEPFCSSCFSLNEAQIYQRRRLNA